MGRKQVVEIQCSRCDRTETREGDLEDPAIVAFSAVLTSGPEEKCSVLFDDLCTPCSRTVRSMLDQIGKRIEGLSPDRKPAAEKKEPAKKPEAKEKGAANGTAPHPAQPAAHPAGSKATAASR